MRTTLLHVVTVWYTCHAPLTIALHAALTMAIQRWSCGSVTCARSCPMSEGHRLALPTAAMAQSATIENHCTSSAANQHFGACF